MRALVRETHLEPGDAHLPALPLPRRRRPQRDRLHARRLQSLRRRSREGSRRQPPRSASAACCSSAFPSQKTSRPPAPGTTTASCSAACARSSKSAAAKKLVLIADVCLCEYTSHGHCGDRQTEDGDDYEDRERLHPRPAREDRRRRWPQPAPTSSPPAT